ncbi:MAG: hypothetical protein WC071_06965 [Victivallaceae bacterium]
MAIVEPKFGISLDYYPTNAELPAVFAKAMRVIELSGFFLTEDGQSAKIRKKLKSFERIFFRDALSPAMTREMPQQSGAILAEFKHHFRGLLKLASKLNSRGFSADFDIERAFSNDSYRQQMLSLLKCFYGELHASDLNLLLPVRVPFLPEVTSAEQYLDILKQLMFPNIKLSIDIHPHELAGKPFSPSELLHWLRFDTAVIRFVYEPETGNHLVEKLITPWLDWIKQSSMTCDVIFVPIVTRSESFENELIFLEELISGLKNQ